MKLSLYDANLHKAFLYDPESELAFLGAPVEGKEWKPLVQQGKKFLVPHSFDTTVRLSLLS